METIQRAKADCCSIRHTALCVVASIHVASKIPQKYHPPNNSSLSHTYSRIIRSNCEQCQQYKQLYNAFQWERCKSIQNCSLDPSFSCSSVCIGQTSEERSKKRLQHQISLGLQSRKPLCVGSNMATGWSGEMHESRVWRNQMQCVNKSRNRR